jgi:hypothetical protein
MPTHASEDHGFAQVACGVVEQSIGETLDGSPPESGMHDLVVPGSQRD